MKHYIYALVFAFVLIIGASVRVDAQTNPSGTPNTATSNYPDNRTNYNYLGLLGLLGLYGLHKKRVKDGTVVDRRAA